MKNVLLFLVLLFASVGTKAQSDTLFIEKTDGSMLVLPCIYIEGQTETSTAITYNLVGNKSVTLSKSDIASQRYSYPRVRPSFESFKFNNKFNDQLFTDAIGEIDDANHKVSAQVSCIGKRLTPSFKVPDGVEVYANGSLQQSKESRLRFEGPVKYTLAYPNQTVYRVTPKAKTTLWTFGPVWDFDWSYGYDGPSQYFIYNADTDLFYNTSGTGVNFFKQLLRGSETVKRAYYLLWKDFMESGKLDELIEYCDDYYEYANPSFQHNSTQWSDGNNYSTQTTNAKEWLRKRANYIYRNLTKYE